MPDTVDARRARGAQHDAAVAALRYARTRGAPDPPNPWRAEMVTAVLAAALITASLAAHVRLHHQRPPGTPLARGQAGRWATW